jgi:hypothetical protein
MKNQKGNITIAAPFALVVLALIVIVAVSMVQFNTQETVSVTVTDKERVTTADHDGKVDSKYLIFTETETFENTDSIFAAKFNSSDFYGKMQKGDSCTFVVTGWRVPMMSMYRNIIKMDCTR